MSILKLKNLFALVSGAALILFLIPFLVHRILNIGNITGIVIFALLTVFFSVPKSVYKRLKQWTKNRVVAWVVKIFSALAVVVVLLTVVISSLMIYANLQRPFENATVIVLGCGVEGTRPSLMLTERLNGAYDYLVEHPQAVCILSGGQGEDEEISESECMYRWLVDKGISSQRLIKEDRSTSTQENLRFSRAIIEEYDLNRHVAIVTHDFHGYRAAAYAKEEALIPSAIPVQNRWWLFPTFYVRELYGVLDLWLL
ncbi:MAG: YdcF family protein [Fastidiosipilaceae bacterium]|jgi:uncharacterized SAM-binding protein YcdF (DUF218 family)|nr:YdcF family protein [Clostridiaceae bacterium]